MDWKNYSLQTQNADWAFLDEMLRRSKSKKIRVIRFFRKLSTQKICPRKLES